MVYSKMSDLIYQPQIQRQSVEFKSGAKSILDTANAYERLSARLSGNINAVVRMNEPILNEQAVNRALEDVKAGKIDSDNVALVARQAYRDTANKAMMAKIETDGVEFSKNIINQQDKTNKYDAERYNKMMSSYSKGIVGGIKDPVIKANAESRLASIGVKGSASVATLQNKQVREMQTRDFKAYIGIKSDAFNKAFNVNNEEAATILNDVRGSINSMVQSGLISPNEGGLMLKNFTAQGYKYYQTKQASDAIESGKFFEFYKSFSKAEHGDFISIDEEEEMKTSFMSMLANQNKVEDRILKEEEQAEIQSKEDTIKSLNTAFVDGILDQARIDKAFKDGYLTKDQYKGYLDMSVNANEPLVDNQSIYTMMRTHISDVDLTEDDIINSSFLTAATKRDLITLRRAELSKADNWKTTQGAREASRTIKAEFNIIEGQMYVDIGARVPQGYNLVYRKWFDRVEEKRRETSDLTELSQYALRVADEEIENYKNGVYDSMIEANNKRKQNNKSDTSKQYTDEPVNKFVDLLKTKENEAVGNILGGE